MIKYPQHSIGARMPKMSDSDFLALKANMAENGYDKSQPVVVFEGRTLDGFHRATAADELGIEPTYIQYLDVCDGDVAPLSFVWSKNKVRRHLLPMQLAALAVDLVPDLQKEAEKRKKSKVCKNVSTVPLTAIGTVQPTKGESVALAAKSVGAGYQAVQIAKKVKEQLPDVFDKMVAGTISIKKAKNELYKKAEAEKKATVDIEINDKDIQLHHCDIADCKVENNSIDLILTDLPYPKGYLSCWSHLARFATDKLKDGGILVAMSGQSYLPEVMANMKVDGLNYYWTCCVYQPGTTTQLQVKRLNCNWKPLLVYVKGTYTKTFQPSDVYISDYKDTLEGKQYHVWGQNFKIFDKLVQDWSYAGETVCDPFFGGGTSAIAAITNKRKFVGVEISKMAYDIAKQRIKETLESINGPKNEIL